MHPILFRLPFFDWPLHTYGVMIVTGFLAAMYVAWREAERQGRYVDEVLDFAFWALRGGMIGARVVFILVNWKQYFVDSPIDHIGPIPVPAVLVIWKGGLVFYGAALGGLAAYFWYTKSRGILGVERLRLADMIVVGLPLAHVFGRLGCVAAGCCWGDPSYHLDAAGNVISDIPLAIQFPQGSLAYQSLLASASPDVAALMRQLKATVPLIPVQLIESFGEGVVFLILMAIRSRKWFHGQLLLSYFILYPALRSTVEMFRGDSERGYVIPGLLSTSQFISLCVATCSIIAIFVIRSRSNAKVGEAAAAA